MITFVNKVKLACVTLFMDLCLLYILDYEKNLSSGDIFFIYSILSIHLLLFIALYKSFYKLVDILHVVMFLSLVYGLYLNNFLLKCLILFLLAFIQVMWTIEKECIMNTKPFGPGYGKMVGIATFFYTIVFTFCLGYTKKDMYDTHFGNNGNILEQNVDQNNLII